MIRIPSQENQVRDTRGSRRLAPAQSRQEKELQNVSVFLHTKLFKRCFHAHDWGDIIALFNQKYYCIGNGFLPLDKQTRSKASKWRALSSKCSAIRPDASGDGPAVPLKFA